LFQRVFLLDTVLSCALYVGSTEVLTLIKKKSVSLKRASIFTQARTVFAKLSFARQLVRRMEFGIVLCTGMRIRIQSIRIRIQHFRLNTDPDLLRIRIQSGSRALMTKNWEKIQLKKKFNFFVWSNTTIYLSLGLHKERPSYRRSLQLSEEAIQHFKTWTIKKFLLLWVILALLEPDPDSESGPGSTDPTESGSNPDPIRNPASAVYKIHILWPTCSNVCVGYHLEVQVPDVGHPPHRSPHRYRLHHRSANFYGIVHKNIVRVTDRLVPDPRLFF
jgi:hypothetical protein